MERQDVLQVADDPSGRTAVQEALETNTVIRQIFRCFNVPELIKFSTINKTWNYEARCVLKEERRCIASIKGQESCNEAKLFNEQLGRMNVIFYNGLSVEPCIKNCPCNGKLGIQKMKDVVGKIMKMPLKFLEINWKTGSCLLGQLASTFLKRSMTLEYLNIIAVPFDEELWATQKRHGLPKLKILEICDSDEEYLENLFQTNFLTEITSRAVNLEELKFTLDVELYYLFPPQCMNLVKSMRFGSDVDNPNVLRFMEQIHRAQPRFRSLHIEKPRFISSADQVISSFTSLSGILNSSRETLERLTIDISSFRPLARRLVAPLDKVTELEFWVCQGDQIGIRQLLLPVNAAETFPSVRTVSFASGHFEQPNLAFQQVQEMFPWPAVDKVILKSNILSELCIRDLRILFPRLRSLTATPCPIGPRGIPFEKMWDPWPLLEELEIGNSSLKFKISWDENFDAIFCGIYPKEAEMLREQDEEFLRKVNIVPAFPAISHLRGLKNVRIRLETDTVFPPKVTGVPLNNMFLSKVTGLMALKQLPDLDFQVTAPFEAANHLAHLEQFLKLNLLPPDPKRTTGGIPTWKGFNPHVPDMPYRPDIEDFHDFLAIMQHQFPGGQWFGGGGDDYDEDEYEDYGEYDY